MPFSVRDLSSLGAVWSRPAQETRLPVSLSCQGLGVGDRYSVKPQAEASHQFIHSLTHSFIRSLIHSFIHQISGPRMCQALGPTREQRQTTRSSNSSGRG